MADSNLRTLTTMALLLLLTVTAPAGADQVGDWQRQWHHVLERMSEETDVARGRAAQLLGEATRLRDTARQRLADNPDGDLHTAVEDYDRAQLAFDKALKASQHAQRMLRELEDDLRRANPGNLRLLDDDVRDRFRQARRQLTSANNAMRAGVSDYNAGIRRYDDAPGMGRESLAAFVRDQSQQKAFAVTRMIAQTKSALIELRDQKRFLKQPDCEPDIHARYQAILDTLNEAHRSYLDADSVPTEADRTMARADAAFEQARTDTEAALSRFEQCLRR